MTPTRTAPVTEVREWIRGRYPLYADTARYNHETPRENT